MYEGFRIQGLGLGFPPIEGSVEGCVMIEKERRGQRERERRDREREREREREKKKDVRTVLRAM